MSACGDRRVWHCSHCRTDQHTTEQHDAALQAIREADRCGNAESYGALLALLVIVLALLAGVLLGWWVR